MNPASAWGWWAAAAVAGGLWAVRRGAWESALGAAVGLALGCWALTVGGLLLGAGFAAMGTWRQAIAARDAEEAEAEHFLEQVVLVARTEPSLAQVVDRSLPLRLRPIARRLDRLGDELAGAWSVPAMAQAARAWDALARHGGPAERLAAQLLAQLRVDRRLRWERTSALSGARGTLAILALAPFLVVLLFRGMVPSFYAEVAGTLPGEATLVLAGGAAWAVLSLAHREAVAARPSEGERNGGRRRG